ncbi:MAG: ATP-dependent 6-phosphofructokinase [bacterium]
MKRIAVITTGGDAPGMNAAIRAVVRSGISAGVEVFGVEEGYIGLIKNQFVEMKSTSVSGIINRGGTILRTVRAKAFHEKNNRQIAYAFLKARRIDGIVVIGGDGSREGMYTITKESLIPSAFIPASIDNDVYGTDYTVGFDTAVNTGLDAIDRIRDTAASHERIFVVEVMGREHGFLALEIGLTGGAEAILIPEFKDDVNLLKLCKFLRAGINRGKNSSIVVMAEGAGSAAKMAPEMEKIIGMEVRYSVLGYIQRGGTPTAFTRKLGLTYGYEAVKTLLKLKKGQSKMVGMNGSKLSIAEVSKLIGKERKVNKEMYNMNKVFAT